MEKWPKGWLDRVLNQASEAVDQWPEWMKGMEYRHKGIVEIHERDSKGKCIDGCRLCAEINEDMIRGVLPKVCLKCGANFPARLKVCPECVWANLSSQGSQDDK